MAKKDWINKGPDGLTFGERLGDLISKRGVTASKIAAVTGIPQSAFSEYINGKENGTKTRAPDCAAIIALANYFSVSADYLLGITPDPSRKPSAVEDLELSPLVIEQITEMKQSFGSNCTTVLNELLEHDTFWHIVTLTYEYKKASLAEQAFNQIKSDVFAKHSANDLFSQMRLLPKINEEIQKAITEDTNFAEIRFYLEHCLNSFSSMEDSQPHELLEYKIQKKIVELLKMYDPFSVPDKKVK